jgi:Trypsin.
LTKQRIFTSTIAAIALAMSVSTTAAYADSGSKNNSDTSSSTHGSYTRTSTSYSRSITVTAPVTSADGTKIVTAHKVSVKARKTALAQADNLKTRAKQRQTRAYKAVQRYWTAKRMKNAKPAPPLTKKQKDKMASAVEKAKKSAGVSTNANKEQSGKPSPNGKIFFHSATRGDYVCSGSAVDGPTKRVVITAAHCVHDGRGGDYVSNWKFVPNYDKDNYPYGSFFAKYMIVPEDYKQKQSVDSDIAFVTTQDNEKGQRLVDTVGGHKLVAHEEGKFQATVIGYPSNLADGKTIQKCKNTAEPVNYMDPQKQTFHEIRGCQFGGGSSGGPWLENYNESTGVGEVHGVTSYGPPNLHKGDYSYVGSVPFDKRVTDLFNQANNQG